MQRLSPRPDRPSEPLMRRLDRVAGEINPFLVILAVGLVILNLARLATLGLSSFPITRVDPTCVIPPSPGARSVGTDRDTVGRPVG